VDVEAAFLEAVLDEDVFYRVAGRSQTLQNAKHRHASRNREDSHGPLLFGISMLGGTCLATERKTAARKKQ
jgi:hypothetical protein